MIPSRALIASSNLRNPRACSPRIPNAITPVISPAGNSGTPNSRFSPIAAPMNSARSVDIAMISACTHIPQVNARGKCSRTTSG